LLLDGRYCLRGGCVLARHCLFDRLSQTLNVMPVGAGDEVPVQVDGDLDRRVPEFLVAFPGILAPQLFGA